MGITLSTAGRNAAVDAVTALIDVNGPGDLRISTGLSFSTILATLVLSNPAFGASSGGTADAFSITSDTNTGAGTATHFQIRDGNGTEIMHGTVGTSGTDLILNSTTFTSGGIASLSSLTISQPAT